MKIHILKLQVLFLLVLLLNNPVCSQSKFEVSAGLGMPELINVKAKYGQNIQVGASLGFVPIKWFGDYFVDWSVATEISYHALGKSKFVDQPPWYILIGIGYFHLNVLDPYENYDVGFYPRIGRTLNFSKKTGVNLDSGLFLPFSTSEFKVLWSGDISFFIRL